MTAAEWTAPGSHAVQFYDNEQVVHHAIAEYFTRGALPSDPLIMVSRPRTFQAVVGHVASGRFGGAVDPASRIVFIDAEAALSQIIEGETLELTRAERLFTQVLSQAAPSHGHGAVRLYGEIVDILCQHGRHATALQFEGLASVLQDARPQLSILCGYATDRFKDDINAARLRGVCEKHTHIVPAGSFTDGLEDHTRHRHAERVQRDAPDRIGTQPPQGLRTSDSTAAAQTIYVIDDHAGLRGSLSRLLAMWNCPVRTFKSAEAFLAERDALSKGCLVVDVELQGMSGLELIRQLTDVGSPWPVIVMSGLHNSKIEAEALRLGARAYLRKPFDPQALFDAILRSVS